MNQHFAKVRFEFQLGEKLDNVQMPQLQSPNDDQLLNLSQSSAHQDTKWWTQFSITVNKLINLSNILEYIIFMKFLKIIPQNKIEMKYRLKRDIIIDIEWLWADIKI